MYDLRGGEEGRFPARAEEGRALSQERHFGGCRGLRNRAIGAFVPTRDVLHRDGTRHRRVSGR